MKICILTSGHDVFDNRIYFKEILSLKKIYSEIYMVAPGEKDFITEQGIIVKCFKKRKAWYDRFRPMKEMFDLAFNINADVYHAHEPDSFQVALKLKKRLNSKAIFDSHEYHPEAFAEHFPVGKTLVTKIIYLYEKIMCKKADYIISVNDILVDKFKRYNKNVALIPNYPNMESVSKEYSEKPTFIYVGGIREDRGILKILEAIELVDKDYKFVFLGSFQTEEFKFKIENFLENNLKNKDIVFPGKVPHLEVFNYLKKADVGFVILQPNNWRYINSEPIKLFEYMISKTAIIASDFPMMRTIVEDAQCGVLVNPTDKESIADAIRLLGIEREKTKQMASKGNEIVVQKYSWSIVEKTLLHAYSKLEKNT
jgi:glycosyltransferase involved in cell wall biosynthesis